jgi:hypothetical protein
MILRSFSGRKKMKTGALSIGAFAVVAFTVMLSGCSDKDSELKTTIADCQLDAHREIDERVSDAEKHKFALGESSTACIKNHGFRPTDKADCKVEPQSSDGGKAFVKPLLECWTK